LNVYVIQLRAGPLLTPRKVDWTGGQIGKIHGDSSIILAHEIQETMTAQMT